MTGLDMGSCVTQLFSEIDKLRAQLLSTEESMAENQSVDEEISQ